MPTLSLLLRKTVRRIVVSCVNDENLANQVMHTRCRDFQQIEVLATTFELLPFCRILLTERMRFVLREDKFFDTVPSLLITGRGFPDLATR